MRTGEQELIREMIVLTIKDYQRGRITARKCETFCALCGVYIRAEKLSDSLLKWNHKVVDFK